MADSQNASKKVKNQRNISHSSIYDTYVEARVNEVSYMKQKKISDNQYMHNDLCRKFSGIRECYAYNTPYVTSEKYHALNKRSSDKSIFRSTSTLFYDLDNLAKRHSYHCIPDAKISINNILRPVRERKNNNGFDAKTNAIVQECATDVQPMLSAKDSIAILSNKVRKSSPNGSLLSSQIYLKDSEGIRTENKYKDKQQKFWSYAKYRTEYTKPVPEQTKMSKTDRGKRTEDPCPCQLFSYACPCTDDKSLTELAGNSKTTTVANQMISAMRISSCQRVKVKTENAAIIADKETCARPSDLLAEYESARIYNDRNRRHSNQNGSNHTCNEINSHNSCKSRGNKTFRQVLCPNCNERVKVDNTFDYDGSLKQNMSPIHRMQDNTSPAQYSYTSNVSQKSKPLVDKDSCKHEPPCELVPVCQILPSEQVYSNSTKCFKGVAKSKNASRSIKVTKACRHHPPCTVAPSCQRLNVLKNNCEYIPPCLHRPRCINLPLCVPFSKTLDYDDLMNKSLIEEENVDYPVFTTPKYMPAYARESFNNNIERCLYHTHNTCEYINEYEPKYFLSPKMACTTPKYSPYQLPPSMPYDLQMSTKSCQYESNNSKQHKRLTSKDSEGDSAIIYIRDVGCQFRNKHNKRDSNVVPRKTFSSTLDEDQSNANYFANFHTLRYEDKSTNPVLCGDHSVSTVSTSSIEIDIDCPSHGKSSKRGEEPKGITGFEPRQSPIVANCCFDDPILKLCMSTCNELNSRKHTSRKCLQSHGPGSRKFFLKNKYRKVFSMRRRRNSRMSGHTTLESSSRIFSTEQNAL